MVLSDEEDVQELSAETAHKQSAFGGAAEYSVLESSSADDSSFFSPGYTIPPLCPGALEQAKQAGTSGSATAFSYYMSQVCLYSELINILLVFLCCLSLTLVFVFSLFYVGSSTLLLHTPYSAGGN